MTPTCSVETHATDDGENANCQSKYGPDPAPVDRCGSTRALHVRGGPFREWGGGIGKRLDNLADAAGTTCPRPPPESHDPSVPAVCPEFDPLVADAPGGTIGGGTGQQDFRADLYYRMMVDLREWDGIAFWARRGPDSQAGFRVVLGDKNLDDDASMLATAGGITNPRCRRAKECDCKNHRPCTPDSDGILKCWDPKLEDSPQNDPWSHEPLFCGASKCKDAYDAYESEGVADIPFLTSCNSYVFKNDITHDQCFDPSGEPPPESSERCGDPWFSPVRLSTDWQFFRVPFSELRQEGYGKEFPAIDLSAVTMVRFTWQQGWVDFWLDDVRFFRRRR
jgi:hypothetical protein